MNETSVTTQSLLALLTTLWEEIGAFIPSFAGALLVLLGGWLVAKLIKAVSFTLFKKLKLDNLSEQSGLAKALVHMGIKQRFSECLANTLFVLVLLVFIVAATDVLGLEKVSNALTSLTQFIPKLIAALAILMGGLLLANYVKSLVQSSLEASGIDYAKPVASATYLLVLLLVVSFAISQLDVDATLFNYLIGIVIGAVAIGSAISIGLGTRDISHNIVSSLYVKDMFQVGDRVEIDGEEGDILQVGPVKTLIKLDSGNYLSLPNSVMVNHKVTVKR